LIYEEKTELLRRGLSYLSALGLEWGIAVNFGKKNLEITGLRVKR
jgi:hypothetical protein